MSADRLNSDASFQQSIRAFAVSVPADRLTPLDGFSDNFRRFTEVRRREVRIGRLENANRGDAAEWRMNRDRVADGLNALCAALGQLAETLTALDPLLTPALDEVIALTSDPDHPLRQMIGETCAGLGIAPDEIEWLFTELSAVDHRPVRLICADNTADLHILLGCLSRGENGVLLAGFPRFTGDAAADERIGQVVVRLRDAGMTASLFLVLIIALAAHYVATCQRMAGGWT